MKFNINSLEESNLESEKKSPDFESLDVKGREIAGLRPESVSFSQLTPGKDYEVLQVNNNINLGSVGQDELYVFVNPSKGDVPKLIEPPHWRTIATPGVDVSTSTPYGVEYFFEADTKGVGYLKPIVKGEYELDDYDSWVRIDEYGQQCGYGIATEYDFFPYSKDVSVVDISRMLLDAGVRTEVYQSCARLDYVIYKGQRTSVNRLYTKGILPKGCAQPHMGVRFFKLNNRIAEVYEYARDDSSDWGKDRARGLFQKAFDAYNREAKLLGMHETNLALGDPDAERQFFSVFGARMGANLAGIHNIGHVHWNFHSANITLAAEVADIGTCIPLSAYEDDEKKMYHGLPLGVLKDLRDVALAIKLLLRAGRKLTIATPNRSSLVDVMMATYANRLEESAVQNLGVDSRDRLVNMAQLIFKAVLVEGKRLPAIKHGNSPDSWGLE